MFLPVLLFCLLCSLSLKASLPQVEECRQDASSPLMMVGAEGSSDRTQTSENQASAEEGRANEESRQSLSEENDNTSSTQPRGSMVESDVYRIVIENYSQTDDIVKKRSAYEQELSLLAPDTDRAALLTKIIPLFEQAALYRNQMILRLLSDRNRTRSQGLQNSFFLKNIMAVTNHPNMVERLIKEIEQDHQELTCVQAIHWEVENEIASLQNQEQYVAPSLVEAVQFLKASIASYNQLIQLKVDAAKLITIPDANNLDQENQTVLEAIKIDTMRTAVSAQQRYFIARNRIYRVDIDVTNPNRLLYLNNSDIILNTIASEVQREQPRQEVIDFLFSADAIYQRALDTLDNPSDPNREQRARYLSIAALDLHFAAIESKRVQPNQESITRLLQESQNWKIQAGDL